MMRTLCTNIKQIVDTHEKYSVTPDFTLSTVSIDISWFSEKTNLSIRSPTKTERLFASMLKE